MSALASYVHACPKVELHVHLEGAIRPARLVDILARHGLHTHLRRPEDVAPLYRHADFAEFLDHFRFVVLALRDVQDVHDVALDLFLELRAQRVIYAEVIFSAPVFTRAGMPLGELLAAVDDAAARAEAELPAAAALWPPRYNIVVDLVRNFGAGAAHRTVDDLVRLAHPRVRGIHLGGDERAFPARDFEAAFAAAREAGLGCAAHAGEADGAWSVRDAVEMLGVTRVGHGIRSVEDDTLLRMLADRGVTLEVCPTSNLRTGVVPSWELHPLPQLLAAGVPVTLGADDPSFFDTDLEHELLAAHERLGSSRAALDEFADAGLRAAFVPNAERVLRLDALRAARAAVGAAPTGAAGA